MPSLYKPTTNKFRCSLIKNYFSVQVVGEQEPGAGLRSAEVVETNDEVAETTTADEPTTATMQMALATPAGSMHARSTTNEQTSTACA
jgi:hypothetical protein